MSWRSSGVSVGSPIMKYILILLQPSPKRREQVSRICSSVITLADDIAQPLAPGLGRYGEARPLHFLDFAENAFGDGARA